MVPLTENNCTVHQKLLNIYCETCNSLICHRCLCDHKSHVTTDIDSFIGEIKKQSTSDSLNGIKKKMRLIQRNIELEEILFDDIESQYKRQLEILDNQFKELADLLYAKQNDLRRELDSYYEESRFLHATQIDHYKSGLHQYSRIDSLLERITSDDASPSDSEKIDFINAYTFVLKNQPKITTTQQKIFYPQFQLNHTAISQMKEIVEGVALYDYLSNASSLENENDYVVLFDQKLSQKQLYLKSIEMDPLFSEAYFRLGCAIDEDELIRIPGQGSLNKIQLFLKSLKTDFNCNLVRNREIYFHLANLLEYHENITLPNGDCMNRERLLTKGLEIDQISHDYYSKLVKLISSGERSTVTLLTGEIADKSRLCTLDFMLNPKPVYATYLAYSMRNDELLDLQYGGRKLTKKQVYLKSIEFHPTYSVSYNNLGLLLKPDEVVHLPDGRLLTQRDLFIEAIHYSFSFSSAYNCLGSLMADDEIVQLKDSRSLSKKEMFLESIKYDSSNKVAYLNLSELLKDEETIQLPNTLKIMTKEQLKEIYSLKQK